MEQDHERDYDRDQDREDHLEEYSLQDILEHAREVETELMKQYMITAERIHNNPVLKERLQNFAEGNAKRTRQLEDEISRGH